MNKYIDAEKLREEIEFAKSVYSNPQRVVHGIADAFRQDGRAAMCDDILKKLDSLQQEQSRDKQIVIITESHGDANIKWDCRSLDDVIILLKSAENFIAEKQIEKIAGPGSGPDYATTEGRYSHLFKHQQERPDLPSGEDVMTMCNQILIDWVKEGKTPEEVNRREEAHSRFFELYDDYLMREQPEVDLKEELKRYLISDKYLYTPENVSLLIAHHFYELGLKARKT